MTVGRRPNPGRSKQGPWWNIQEKETCLSRPWMREAAEWMKCWIVHATEVQLQRLLQNKVLHQRHIREVIQYSWKKPQMCKLEDKARVFNTLSAAFLSKEQDAKCVFLCFGASSSPFARFPSGYSPLPQSIADSLTAAWDTHTHTQDVSCHIYNGYETLNGGCRWEKHPPTIALIIPLCRFRGLGAPRWGAWALSVWGSWGQGSSFHQPLVPQRLPLQSEAAGESRVLFLFCHEAAEDLRCARLRLALQISEGQTKLAQ